MNDAAEPTESELDNALILMALRAHTDALRESRRQHEPELLTELNRLAGN